MDEEAGVRRDLERVLGSLPDSVWQELVEDKLVEMHLRGVLEIDDQEASWGILEMEAQKRLRRANRHVSEALKHRRLVEGNSAYESHGGEWRWVPRRMFLEESVHEPTKAERMVADYYRLLFHVDPKSASMMRATSSYIGRLADRHPRVVEFRERVLGRRTLTLAEARKLLGSFAARFFPFEWFLDRDIPIVGHTAEIVGEYDCGSNRDEIDHRVTVRVDPLGIIESVRYAHPDAPLLDEDEDHISSRCVLRDNKRRGMVPPFNVSLPEDPEAASPPEGLTEVKIGDGQGERSAFIAPLVLAGNYHTPTRPTVVWPGSVVGDLYALAEELAEAFCWAGRDVAAEFVLTGGAPLMHPLKASMKLKGDGSQSSLWRLELDVSPWVSAEEVARAYRQMQEQILPGRNRLPDARTLRVASFVWEQERQNGYSALSWPDLLKRWNQTVSDPEDRFEDYRHLRTYFKRAEETITEYNFDEPTDDGGFPDE